MLQFRKIYYPEVRCQVNYLYWEGYLTFDVKVGEQFITVPRESISWYNGESYVIGEFTKESVRYLPDGTFIATHDPGRLFVKFPGGEVISVRKEDLRSEAIAIG